MLRRVLPLTLYEARFVDYRDDVFSTREFSARNDDAAKDYVKRVFRMSVSIGHEIWNSERFVHREIYSY